MTQSGQAMLLEEYISIPQIEVLEKSIRGLRGFDFNLIYPALQKIDERRTHLNAAMTARGSGDYSSQYFMRMENLRQEIRKYTAGSLRRPPQEPASRAMAAGEKIITDQAMTDVFLTARDLVVRMGSVFDDELYTLPNRKIAGFYIGAFQILPAI